MAHSSRRVRLLAPASVGVLVMLIATLGPAQAAGPGAAACPSTPVGYCKTQVTWTARPGVAGYPVTPGGPSGPGGPVMDSGADVRSASVSYDDHFLHFQATLAQATDVAPPGMSAREFLWRFTYGGQAFAVDFVDYFPGGGGVILPDYLGVTITGTDTWSPTECSSCVGHIDPGTNSVSFFVDLETWSTFVGSLVSKQTLKTAPPALERGTLISALEMEVWADTAAVTATAPEKDFEEVVAPAPKTLTYTM